MQVQTEMAIRGMLKLDPEIRPEDIERAMSILKGEDGKEKEIVQVLKCKDVVKYLHICRRTLDNYVAKGYLDRVYGGTGRAIGISRASYERFTERERLAQSGVA